MGLDNPHRYTLRDADLVGKPSGNRANPVEPKPFVVDDSPLFVVAHSPARMLICIFRSYVCNGFLRDVWADFEATKRWVRDMSSGRLSVSGLGDGESHVGLPGCQPDFAD